MLASLRDCFRLQVIGLGSVLQLTLFGRARLLTGAYPMTEQPEFYMLYWVKLPVFQHRYTWLYDKPMMCQAVLMWHGKHGFRVRWEPTPDDRL